MDWIQVLVMMLVMIGTVLGIVIPLHLSQVTRIDAFQAQTLQMHRDIHNEMKDFHGRLVAIEERSKIKKDR